MWQKLKIANSMLAYMQTHIAACKWSEVIPTFDVRFFVLLRKLKYAQRVCVQIHTYWITIYRSTSVSLIFGLHILILDMQYNIRNAFHVLDINIPLIESIQLSSFCVLKSGAKAAERKRKGKSMASIGRLHSLCIYFPVNVVVLFKMYWMRT